MENHGLPEIGDVVVVKIMRVLDYGAFVELEEFDHVQGFVHISEIASRWVKNIRNHVKENQVRAAKVLAIKRDKNQIDLSLTKVSEGLQRAKLDEWKKTKRSQKLIEVMAQKQKAPFDAAWKAIAEPLLEKHESLFEALQQIALRGKSAAEGIPADWVPVVVETCSSSIEVPEKTVEAELSLSSGASNGLEQIRDALLQGQKASKEKVALFYEGSGKYSVRVTAENFKSAEKELAAVTETTVAVLTAAGGKATVKRIER